MKRYCLMIVLCIGATSVKADLPRVSLTDHSTSVSSFPIQYLEDRNHAIELRDARQATYSNLDTSQVNFGFTQSRYWLRFAVTNSTQTEQTSILKTTARFMRPLVIFQGNGEDIEQVLFNDEHSEFISRPGNSRHIGHQFNLAPGETTEFYLLFGAGGAAALGLTLATPQEVTAEQSETTLKIAIFVAIIGTLILSNLFYFLAIRAVAFLSYVVQESVFVLYVAHMEGFTFQYVWPTLPWLNANATPVIGGLSLLSAFWFSINFLQSKQYTPRYYRVLQVLMAVLVVNTLLSVFLSNRVFNQTGFLLFFVLVANLVPHAIYVVSKGHLAARYYLAGWGILMAMIGWFIGSIQIGYSIPISALDIVKIGMTGEAIVLSMGLADQYRRINTEKNEMQANLVNQLNIRLEEARERAQLEQEKENALKEVIRNSRVLATTSHDIAQPLNALKLSVKTMEIEYNRQTLDSLKNTIEDLEALVGSALDDASGALQEVRREVEVDLDKTVNDVCQRFLQDAIAKGLYIRQHTVPLTATISDGLLRRCLSNLLSNAIRFTDKGGVLVAARVKREGVLIQVFDTGVGMDNQTIASALNEHTKAGGSGGHGLGLSIVKSICEQCGWTLDIRSTVGRGSSFSITIPQVARP